MNLPLEAAGRESNLERQKAFPCFPLLYFKSALWPVQRNSLFRIGDVVAILDNAATRRYLLHDENDHEKLVLFSPSADCARDKMTSQATSVDFDPIPPLLLGHFLFR